MGATGAGEIGVPGGDIRALGAWALRGGGGAQPVCARNSSKNGVDRPLEVADDQNLNFRREYLKFRSITDIRSTKSRYRAQPCELRSIPLQNSSLRQILSAK